MKKAFFLAVLAIFSFLSFAENSEEKIRVGFFHLDGYQQIDGAGEKSGYGYDFLQLIAGYGNFKYEYIGYNQHWPQMMDALKNEKIDILTFAKKSQNIDDVCEFSEHSIGTSYGIVTVSAKNPTFQKNGFRFFDGMRIGMMSVARAESFEKYAKERGLKYVPVYYNNVPEMEADLMAGQKIDAMVSDSLRRFTGEVVLDQFDPRDFYVIVKKGNERLLKKIDDAISALTNTYPSWKRDLYNSYAFSDYNSTVLLSDEEKNYIQGLNNSGKKLWVLFDPTTIPLSYMEDGEAKGTLVDIFKKYAALYNIPYAFIPVKDNAEYFSRRRAGEADIVLDCNLSNDQAEREGWRLTANYAHTGYSMIAHAAYSGHVENVAILKDMDVFKNLVKESFPDSSLVFCNTPKKCFDLLKSGHVDAVLTFSSTAEVLLVRNGPGPWRSSLLEGKKMNYKFGINKDSDITLFSLMNKLSRGVDDSEVDSLNNIHIASETKTFTLMDYFRLHPNVTVLLIFLAFGILLSVTLVFRHRTIKEISNQRRVGAMARAIRKTYIGFYHYDLQTWTGEEIGMDSKKQRYMSRLLNIDESVSSFEKNDLTPEVAAANRDFWDFFTMNERLKDRDILTLELPTKTHGWVELSIVAYKRAEDGRVTDILWLMREIDEEKKRQLEQQEALRLAKDAANAANRAKTTFLSNMSHDIRTPMNAIVGFAGIATSHSDDKERVQDCLDKILVSSNHLQKLINDILEMSHIESGKLILHGAECSLGDIVENVDLIMKGQIAKKQLDFSVDTSGIKDDVVFCDDLKMNQVLINLLSNAVKYTPDGGSVSLVVNQEASKREGFGQYVFMVRDTGIGMSEEFLQRIFVPFERENTSTLSGVEGTGLGLSITKNIVEKMGGVLGVQSQQGKGTTFTVDVALRLQFGKGRVKKVRKPPVEVSGDALKDVDVRGTQLLLVEDNLLNREIAIAVLTDAGFKVDAAVNGQDALDKLNASQVGFYKIVLMDIQMPVMDGYAATREIRKSGRDDISKIPIIAMTANAFDEDKKKASAAGMNDHISKPVDVGLLLSAIKKYL